MLQMIQWDQFTVRGVLILALVLVAGIGLFRLTQQIVVTALVTVLALGGVAYLLGILTLDQAKAAAGDVGAKAASLTEKAGALTQDAKSGIKAFEQAGEREK